MLNFETYQKGATKAETRPFVTLQVKGPIALNRPAYEALGRPPALELLFDPHKQVVGLKGCARDHRNAFPVRAVGNAKSSFMVAGKSFTNYYGIDISQSRRYPAFMEDGILCFDLARGRAATRTRRGGTNGHHKVERVSSLAR